MYRYSVRPKMATVRIKLLTMKFWQAFQNGWHHIVCNQELFIYIADSAMVTGKNLLAIGDTTLLISRLPANYKACLRVIKDAIEKDQYGIEQNFGFLKDPIIVNSIFLKRPERIEVLGLVLLLSLLIWRLIEREMRQYVEREKRDLPGWKRRRTTRPTTFMLVTNFQRIMIIKIGDNRRLNKPFTEKQMEYLVSLKVDPIAFIKPGAG